MIEALAQILCDRFQGREDHYAVQSASGAYRPQAGAFTPEIARGHIETTLTVGVYVLRKNNTCSFAALDFDEPNYSGRYEMEQAALISSRVLTHMGIPHVLERSGRKGYHLWVFFSVPVQASFARTFLQGLHDQVEAELNTKCPVEMFPKQDRIEPEGFGNLIKVPWGLHRVTGNRAVLVDSALEDYKTMDDQMAALQNCRPLTVAEVAAFLEEYPPRDKGSPFHKMSFDNGEKSSVFGKGKVPCTPDLFRNVIAQSKDGGRNKRIYDLAVRLYREGIFSDQAVQQLLRYNAEKCSPPLPSFEVQQTFKSVYSKGYGDLRCEKLQSFCHGEECAIYRAQHNIPPPGVTEDLNKSAPSLTITDLIHITTDPSAWIFTVAGQPVRVNGEDILNFGKIRKIVVQSHGQILYIPRAFPEESAAQAWERILQPLLAARTIEEAPENASERGLLKESIHHWLEVDAITSEDRDELDAGVVLKNDERYPGKALFRFDSLRRYLDMRKIGPWKQHELWSVLRDMGGKTQLIKVGGRPIRVAILPLLISEEEEDSTSENDTEVTG